MSGSLFSEEADESRRDPSALDAALVASYMHVARTLDDLPYTPELDAIVSDVRKVDPSATPRAVFHRLQNIRKAGKLPKIGRAATAPPRIPSEEEERLASLVVDCVGTLGQRDQLPYTRDFDAIVEKFNGETGRSLTPHDVWRLIAKLAK